ncbi:MAG: glycosyltransferase [Pseudomonadota bacterium]
MSAAPDILLIGDPRFAGGTSAALIADAEAFLALGATVGLMFVTSGFLGEGDQPNPAVMALADRDGVMVIPAAGTVRTGTVFLHHPMVFFHDIAERAEIRADRAALVTHHAPFRGDGSLEYDPVGTARKIHRIFGLSPLWAPISGLCRAQLASFAPLIRLTSEDWINTFETSDWTPVREILSGDVLTIGRHGRVDFLKWPETADQIAACLPEGQDRRIRVMGCPEDHLRDIGADMSGWDLVPYGAEPVRDFLDSLDVFSYFHHPLWVETFGRTVAEAALMGRALVLDPALEATFGDIALYPRPAEVSDVIARLVSDPVEARTRGTRAREVALARYSSASVAARLKALETDQGTVARTGARAPLGTLRKTIGLYRRRATHGYG